MNETGMEEMKGLVESIRLEEDAKERILDGLHGKRQKVIQLKRKIVIGRICGATAAVLVLLGLAMVIKENLSSHGLGPIMVYAAPLGDEEKGEWICVSVGEKVPIEADIDVQSYQFTINLPSGPVLLFTNADTITTDHVADVCVMETFITDREDDKTGEYTTYTIKITHEGDTGYIEVIQN